MYLTLISRAAPKKKFRKIGQRNKQKQGWRKVTTKTRMKDVIFFECVDPHFFFSFSLFFTLTDDFLVRMHSALNSTRDPFEMCDEDITELFFETQKKLFGV